MSSALTVQAAAEFLWREADLLDRFRYDEWLDLWTPDGLYIVPVEDDVEDYADVLNYAYDDDAMRRMRIARLKSPHSMSATAGARTVRTVSRFVAVDVGETTLHLRAAQHLIYYLRDRFTLYPADLDVTLRRTDSGDLRLARKVVRLVNRGDILQGMAFLP